MSITIRQHFGRFSYFFTGIPKRTVATMTRVVPMKKFIDGSKSLRMYHDETVERIIDIEVANPLRIASAYFVA